jgi:beta-1,4-N-acetylglucosaminyltransferase
LSRYVPRILGIKHIQVVYVESICRVETLSLTARLLYLFCDGFIVQWEELVKLYPASTYLGRLY